MHTEDHPLEYLEFHGEIPAGEYGGGAMTIWDAGRYEVEKWSDTEVAVTLHGERVEGRFVFFKPDRSDHDEKDWLVQRRKSDAPAPARNKAAQSPRVAVGGRSLRLSNLDKELYPDVPKASVIDYYARVADTILPHLAGRPLTAAPLPRRHLRPVVLREERGSQGAGVAAQRRGPDPRQQPGHDDGQLRRGRGARDAGLLANLAVLELHVPQWRVDDDGGVQPPDVLVFDLDPGERPRRSSSAATVARALRERARRRRDHALPEDQRQQGHAAVRAAARSTTADVGYAKDVAELAGELETPQLGLASMAKDAATREDLPRLEPEQHRQDHRRAVLDAARAANGAPTVSTPLTW